MAESTRQRERMRDTPRDVQAARLAVHALALAPLLILAAQAAASALPINLNRYLMLRSGMIALVLLLGAFACSPLSALGGWRWPRYVRRALGVYATLYAAAHLAVYAVAENALDIELILRDLEERRAMLAGTLALLLMLPLALTSTNGWQRRLGRRWKLLHRLVYAAVPLAALHYLWLERDDLRGATMAAVVAGALLLTRLPPVRRTLERVRRGSSEMQND